MSDGLEGRVACVLSPTTFSQLLSECCGFLMSFRDVHSAVNGDEVDVNSAGAARVSGNRRM